MTNDNANKKTGLRFFTLRIFILLLVSIFILLSVVPINLTSYAPLIKERVEGKINASILLGGVRLRVFPLPTVILNDVVIVGTDDFLFKSPEMKARILFLPLLKGEFKVKQVTSIGTEIFLQRNEYGRMNTSTLSAKKPGEAPQTDILSVDVVLKKSKVAFTDFAIYTPGTMVFSIDEMYLNKTVSGFTYSASIGLLTDDAARLSLSGEVKTDGNTGKNITGTLKAAELRIQDVTPYLRSGSSENVIATGRVSADVVYTAKNIADKNGAGVLKGTVTANDTRISMPAVLNEPVTVVNATTNIDMSWGEGKRTIAFNDTSLSIQDFTIKSSVKFKQPENKVSLAITSSPIDAGKIMKILPYGIMPPKVRRQLEAVTAPKGMLTIKKFSFTNENLVVEKTTDYFKALDAELALNGLGFGHPSFNKSFSSLTGSITLRNADLELRGFRGKYGKGSLDEMFGDLRNLTGVSELKLDAKATLDTSETLAEIKSLLQDKALAGASGSGVALLNLKCSGLIQPLSPDSKNASITKDTKLKLNYVLDLTNSSFQHKNLISKDPGYILVASSEINIDKKSVDINKGTLKFGMSRAEIKGSFSRLDPSYSIALKSEKTAIEDLLPVSPYLTVEDAPVRGYIKFNITKKLAAKAGYPLYTGTAEIKEGLFKTTLVNKTLRDVDAGLKLNGNSGVLTIKKLLFGDSDTGGELRIRSINDRTFDFSLFSNKLRLTDFVPTKKKKSKTAAAASSSKPLKPLTGKGKITAKTGDLYGLNYSSLTSDVAITDKHVDFNKISFVSNGGMVDGNFKIHTSKDDPTWFTSQFTANAIELDSLIEGFGAKKSVITGKLSLRADLKCVSSAPTFSSCLNGKIDAKAKDGKLMQFGIINKVFSVVNILSITELFQEGAPFKVIKGDFDVKNGVISSENTIYDGKSIRMSSIGRIDLPNKSIDAVLALHPFVTIDKVISNIPVVGWIMTGKDKSMITLFYSVKGPLKAPEVKPVTTEEMGRDIQETFLNILKQASEKVTGEKPAKKAPADDTVQ